MNLVVHQLNEVQRQDGRTRAVQERLREIPEAVKKRPAPNGAMPLYGLFQDIIQKDEKSIDKLVRVTQIIFCARQPLHPKQLYVLLHQAYYVPFDSGETSDKILTKHVLEVSKGLAEVTKSEEPTVQFIHETVREFLRDGGLKSISTQSVALHGHEIMKASCLNQIQAPVSEHLQLLADYLRRGHYRKTRINKVTMLKQREFREQANVKFPFLEYASKNLLFHADESEAVGVSQIEFLESFPVAEWVPIYNLFQRHNTRRYNGETTPMLYILAEHGCNQLLKSWPKLRGHYADGVVGEFFRSALACAIRNGHLDAAWTMVGLDARGRSQNIVAPSRSVHGSGDSEVITVLLELGDLSLMRKVLEDGHVTKYPVHINFGLVNSALMLDLLLEFSILIGFPSMENPPGEDREPSERPRSNTDLMYTRRAIDLKPSLLTSKAWGHMTMLEYAVSQNLQPLVSLYQEYSGGIQSDLDAVLRVAAGRGRQDAVTNACRYGANLGSQDENGRTALHFAAGVFVRKGTYGCDEVLLDLLSKEASCVNARDYKGRTALAIAAHGPQGSELSQVLEAFLHAGADINTLIRCLKCKKHDLPLVAFLALSGDVVSFGKVASDDRCNLNGRDSYGRTALSCCFARQHGKKGFVESVGHGHENAAGAIGEQLLRLPAVDVNSRDNFGYTILEHFIRYPFPFTLNPGRSFQSFVQNFFQSSRLDPDLRTSNDQLPLELIVSLYDTWPAEFLGIKNPNSATFSGRKAFNQHLIEASECLLGTGKVGIDVQRRCAERAPPELRSVILGSIPR